MSFCLEDQKPQPPSSPAPRWGFSFWASQVAIKVSNFAQTATAKEYEPVVARHGRAPFRQQLLFRLDVGGSMKLKMGTLLVASTLLDLTPSTALHA